MAFAGHISHIAIAVAVGSWPTHQNRAPSPSQKQHVEHSDSRDAHEIAAHVMPREVDADQPSHNPEMRVLRWDAGCLKRLDGQAPGKGQQGDEQPVLAGQQESKAKVSGHGVERVAETFVVEVVADWAEAREDAQGDGDEQGGDQADHGHGGVVRSGAEAEQVDASVVVQSTLDFDADADDNQAIELAPCRIVHVQSTDTSHEPFGSRAGRSTAEGADL
jgi:hypothetical protein